MPQLSCILPVHQDHDFINEAVQSILNQTFQDFELIIVANNCTDDLWKKLNRLVHPKVKLVRSPIGQLPFALNLGLHFAQGDFIARMDSDDISVPDRFEIQMSYLKDHSEIDILGTDMQSIDEKGVKLSFDRKLCLTNEEIRAKLPISSSVNHATVIFKKQTLLKLRGYAYGFINEDYDLWLRARRDPSIKFHNIAQKLYVRRIHANQNTSNRWNAFRDELTLKLREFLITKEAKFILGMLIITRLGQFLLHNVYRRLR